MTIVDLVSLRRNLVNLRPAFHTTSNICSIATIQATTALTAWASTWWNLIRTFFLNRILRLALLSDFAVWLLLFKIDSSDRHKPLLHSLADLTCLSMIGMIDGLSCCTGCQFLRLMLLVHGGTLFYRIIRVRLVAQILFVIILLLGTLLGIHSPFLGNRCRLIWAKEVLLPFDPLCHQGVW